MLFNLSNSIIRMHCNDACAIIVVFLFHLLPSIPAGVCKHPLWSKELASLQCGRVWYNKIYTIANTIQYHIYLDTIQCNPTCQTIPCIMIERIGLYPILRHQRHLLLLWRVPHAAKSDSAKHKFCQALFLCVHHHVPGTLSASMSTTT